MARLRGTMQDKRNREGMLREQSAEKINCVLMATTSYQRRI